jgi:HK97 family phage major capsid protein
MELTKEQLETLIREKAREEVETAGGTWTESMKGQFKEIVDDALKDFGKSKKTAFDLGEEDPRGGYKNFAEFAKDVYDAGEGLANPSPKLESWNEKAITINKTAGSPAQSVGSLTAGGALIPPEFSANALVRARERSTIMSRAMTIPMSSTSIQIPYLKGFDESQGKVGGNIKFRWVAENGGATGNAVDLGLVELRLREANAMIYVSNNLMKFSPVSIQPFLTTACDDALDLALSDAFVNGTGAGQPKGVLAADCLVSVAKETGQAADTIVYENTLNMLSRFYGTNGEWYASRGIIPQLGVMNVSVGAGGSAVFLANGAGSASGSFPSSLHGAPLNYLDVMPALGDLGDLLLADWSQYLIGRFNGEAGLSVTESAHLKFDYRQTAFQFTFYCDGQPWWPSVMTPKKGNTRSPFVAIAARA